MSTKTLTEYARDISPRPSESEGWSGYSAFVLRHPSYGVTSPETVAILALGFEAGMRESSWVGVTA